jgi:type IV pilus assembly protein PilZ
MPEQSQSINCVFANETDLYAAYMSFLTNGGLFIRSKPGVAPKASIGEELDLSITLPKDPKVYALKVKVVWVTPVGVKGNKPPGYGVMFLGEEAKLLTSQIEKCVGALISSGQPTDTI